MRKNENYIFFQLNELIDFENKANRKDSVENNRSFSSYANVTKFTDSLKDK